MLVFVFAVLCFFVAPCLAQNEVLDATGNVEVLTIENGNQSSRVYRFLSSSVEVDLFFETQVKPPHVGGPFHVVGTYNTPSSVMVSELTSTATLRSEHQKKQFPSSGARTVVIIRVEFSGSSYGEAATAQELTNLFWDGSASIDGFYRYISKNTIYFKRSKSGSNTPDIYTVAIPGSTSCFFVPGEVRNVLLANSGTDIWDWQHHIFALPSGFAGCGSGVGNIGCNHGACNVWANSLRGDVFTHELGHNFGLDHANSNYYIGYSTVPEWQEYVDYSSSMSLSLNKMRRGFNPVDLKNLGVLNGGNIQTLSHPVTTLSYALNDLFADSGTRVIRITDNAGVVHHISYRQGASNTYDADLNSNMYHPIYPGTYADRVFVHRDDPEIGAPGSFVEMVLNKDSSSLNLYTTADNSWSVKFRTSSGGSASLWIGTPAEVAAGTLTGGGSQVPVNCVVSDWSDCSAQCGDGVKTRTIITPAANGGEACPALSEPCNNNCAPVNCVVSGWSDCSAQCGDGTKTRTIITPAANGGEACPALSEPCNNNCVNCVVSDWSECSAQCGDGIKTRTVVTPSANGGEPCPALSEPCNNNCAPVNCVVSGWSDCSAQCGDGTKTRTVITPAANGGSACPALSEPCNNNCVNCVVSDWSDCSTQCGDGVQTRTVVTPSANGGTACPALSQSCNNGPCTEVPSTTTQSTVAPIVEPPEYVPDVVYPFTQLHAPGRIQAEYFDVNGFFDKSPVNVGHIYRPNEGVDIEECMDTGYGYNLAWMHKDEWVQYTVDVDEEGDYRVEFRVASKNGGGQLVFLMDDVGQVGPINIVPTDAWQNYATIQPTQVFPVSKGVHIFKIYVYTPGCNLNYFELIKVNPGDTIPQPGENDPVPNEGVTDVVFAVAGNGVCEPGENCFTVPDDCKGDVSVVVEERFCCSGDRPQGYLTGEGWTLGQDICTPPPSGVLPSA